MLSKDKLIYLLKNESISPLNNDKRYKGLNNDILQTGNRFSQRPGEIGLNDDCDSYAYLAFSNQHFLNFDKFECENENILENIFGLLGLISF